ncbi:hypothetical protein [Pseudoduganella sp. HUAS MS19]
MTAAFDEFMRQYKLTGSEKADGYNRSAFIGLSEDEIETVFGLLVSELPYSAEWLAFVDPERAIAVMKEEEPSLRKDPYAHAYLIQEELVRHSGELVYQSHMIEDYSNYADSLKPLLVSALWRTPQNMNTIAFFKQIILTEANESAVARAAFGVLSALNVSRNTEAEKDGWKRLEGELRSNDIVLKLRALKQLELYETARVARDRES